MLRRLFFAFLLFVSSEAFAQLGQYAEEKFNRYFTENSKNMDPIEGMWLVYLTRETYHFDTLFEVIQTKQPQKIAIMRDKSKFFSYTMDGELFEAEFGSTDVKSVYLYRNYYPLISRYTRNQAVICKAGQMEYTYDLPAEYLEEKLGDQYKAGTRIVNILKWKKTFPTQ